MNTPKGFAPVWDGESRLLILGSFPSVKSRETGFYYGNPQNRFWHTVGGFFGESPKTTEEKRDFLLRRHIALWDIVVSCEVVGSADSSIREETIADIPSLLDGSRIAFVFCNGSKSYALFQAHFPQYLPITRKLSSTSPANPRFSSAEWEAALSEALCRRKGDLS